jgi:hypothetical protein
MLLSFCASTPISLSALYSVIDRFYAFIPADGDRQHDAGKQDGITQRKDRQFLGYLNIIQVFVVGFIQRYDGHEIQIIFGTHE